MAVRRSENIIYNQASGIFFTQISNEFNINNFQIINENIVELEAESSKVNDAINSLSPLVANKVLENMTINEVRALASLPPIEGGDMTQSAAAAVVVTETTTPV